MPSCLGSQRANRHGGLSHRRQFAFGLSAGCGDTCLRRRQSAGARIDAVASDLRACGEVPYHIPTGGSNAVGALGYSSLMLELLQQARDARISLDRIVVASSSGERKPAWSGKNWRKPISQLWASTSMAIPRLSWRWSNRLPKEGALWSNRLPKEGALKLELQQSIRADAYELVRGYAMPSYGLPNLGMSRR
jgi:hypothetical protein